MRYFSISTNMATRHSITTNFRISIKGVNSEAAERKKRDGKDMTDFVQINTLDDELEWEEWKGVRFNCS
jgi:hypothetical protein